MNLHRRTFLAWRRYTLAFVGYGSEASHAAIELTHNWDREERYTIGSGFGHIAIGVEDLYGTYERLKASGVNIPRPPGPMIQGGRALAFVEDPDGYRIELIETTPPA